MVCQCGGIVVLDSGINECGAAARSAVIPSRCVRCSLCRCQFHSRLSIIECEAWSGCVGNKICDVDAVGDVVAQIVSRIDQRRDRATAICRGSAIESGRLAIQADGYTCRWVDNTVEVDISACDSLSVSANAEWRVLTLKIE